MSTPEIIVVGAGPVGLTAALCLARSGMRVLVLDKRLALSTASLASTIHPPTLEIMQALDVLPAVFDRGYRVDRIQHRTPDGVFAEFAMSALTEDTDFPFRLHLEQAVITPVMLAQLRARGADVRFGCQVTSVAAEGDGVHVQAGGEVFRAAYLIAADGAHSTVRAALGIAFEGEDYADKMLRVLTSDDLDALLPDIAPVTYVYNGPRSVSFLRMPDLWRIILRVPGSVTPLEEADLGWIFGRLLAVVPDCARMPAVVGTDSYRASRRVAARFRQGRAYLIGDAAHATSTRGGMNMNCGIHDAAALAHAIASGGAAAADAAADERHRIATELLIPRTHRTVAFGPDTLAKLRATAADATAARDYLRRAAMLDMLDRAPAPALA